AMRIRGRAATRAKRMPHGPRSTSKGRPGPFRNGLSWDRGRPARRPCKRAGRPRSRGRDPRLRSRPALGGLALVHWPVGIGAVLEAAVAVADPWIVLAAEFGFQASGEISAHSLGGGIAGEVAHLVAVGAQVVELF